jgi:hypothetical protein
VTDRDPFKAFQDVSDWMGRIADTEAALKAHIARLTTERDTTLAEIARLRGNDPSDATDPPVTVVPSPKSRAAIAVAEAARDWRERENDLRDPRYMPGSIGYEFIRRDVSMHRMRMMRALDEYEAVREPGGAS